MNKFSIFINSILVIMIVLTIVYQPKVSSEKVNVISKSVTTNTLGGFYKEEKQVEEVKEEKVEIDDTVTDLEDEVSDNVVEASVITDVLETQVGTMSAYGLDCSGCSGNVGAGYNARGNNVRYNDPVYGELRIVAGDSKYPYGTVVRVKDSKIGTFNAIVLDRGGAIGIDKRYMFDLLFTTESEASEFGLSMDTTFEILRYGY